MPLLINNTKPNKLNSPQLLTTAQELKWNLSAIQPNNSETIQTITFALVATAIVGITVYHYIKRQEQIH